MEYRKLGRTDLDVSALCLGTMTFGEQVDEAGAHAQLDHALAAGINFLDTAEMYPVAVRAETYGDTERFIGSWLAARGNREQVILATKVVGPGSGWLEWIRGGQPRLNRSHIEAAVNASLKRLQSDYIDLYQLHWPDRETNYFGKLGYEHPVAESAIPLEETLEVLADLIRAGKVRHVGISNETPWGTMRYLQLAESNPELPRMVSIQNPYNLLNRSFEVGLAEIAHREDLGLLAYSPMAFGTLSGKYLDGEMPAGSRLSLFSNYTRYSNPEALAATAAYVRVAREYSLSPAQMALAWVTSRPFVTSNIITATSLEQLDEDIASAALELPAEVISAIEAIHTRHPNPGP